RLSLEGPLRLALDEQPLIQQHVGRCGVSHAQRARNQGAELYVAPAEAGITGRERRRLRIRLLPSTLRHGHDALRLLRYELLHVADMLDPSFAYEPELPRAEAGPTHDRLLLTRYSALWAATVTGRLVRAGHLEGRERGKVLRRFVQAFPMLAADPEPTFSRFFDCERPAHGVLVELALNPRASLREAGPDRRDPGSRCALCEFPSYSFASPHALEADVVEEILSDFPVWTRADPICPQCVDLYGSRKAARSVS
ncbi:unnamed protein product, partial [marine sediment metagenome]